MADEPPLQPLIIPKTSVPDPTLIEGEPLATQITSANPIPTPAKGMTLSNLVGEIKPADITKESPNRPAIDQILRNYGIDTARPDPFAEMMRNRKAPSLLADPGNPTFEAFPSGTAGKRDTSLWMGLVEGLDNSPFGSIKRFLQLRDGAAYENEPGYDPFRDRQIEEAGLLSQMNLFYGSGSRNNTRWIIERTQEKQRNAAYLEQMGSGAGIAEFAGGLLGDPLTYLPGTAGVKGAALGIKALAGKLTAQEMRLLSPGRAALGSFGDALKYSGMVGALSVAQRAIEHGVDPTMSIEEVTDSLYVPMALAASMTFVVSAMARRTARHLANEVKSPDFLKGTPPSGARYVADEFVGPVIHPTDEAARNLRSPYDDAATRARRMERVDFDSAPGPRREVPFNGLPRDGELPPGSLATHYGPIRTREAMSDPATAAIMGEQRAGAMGRPAGPGRRGFLDEAAPRAVGKVDHEIPADASGARELALNGQSRSAAEFPVGHTIETPSGELWRVNNVLSTKRFERWGQKPDAAEPAPVRPRAVTTKQDIANIDTRGERDIFVNDKRVAALDHEPGTRLIDDKGIEWELQENRLEGDVPKVWKPISTNEVKTAATRLEDMEFAPGALEGEGPGSVGATLSPQSAVYQREVLLAQGRMAPTGIGLEKLPLDPVSRLFMGLSVTAMRLAADLVSTGGRLTIGNLQGIANLPPIEALIRANWDLPVIKAVRAMHDDWAAYRAALARGSGQMGPFADDFSGRTDFRRLADEAGTALKDRINRGEKGLSFHEYRRRVAEALNNGDADELEDAASPFVARSAAAQRKVYDAVRDQALELGIFDQAHKDAVFQAYSGVRAVKKEIDALKRQNPTRLVAEEEALTVKLEDAEFKAKQMEKKLDELRANGPLLNGTSPTYRPRMWDTGALRDGEARFISEIAVPWLRGHQGGAHQFGEAVRIAKEMHTILSRQNPVYERGDVAALFKSVANPQSAMARTFNIPDKLVRDFLVDDAEVLLRYHVKQMGTAIEFQRRFGSLDMADEIAQVEQEYRRYIIDATDRRMVVQDPKEQVRLQHKVDTNTATLHERALMGALNKDELSEYAKEMTVRMKSAVSDVQALRDKLYGTYGAAADPHAWTSRTIRMAKQFSNITLLGMAGVSSLGDFVRPLMTEGLEATYGFGIRSLMSDTRGTILRMARADLEMAGTGMDLMNNVRALQAADTGDVFGSRGRIEHALNQANQWMFVANGLNQLTEWSKRWSSVIIQGNMNNVLLDFGQGVAISDFNKARLAANGIDLPTAERIALQLKIHGQSFGGATGLHLANLTRWNDELAAEAYKSALFQQVERTIVTPGVGDRPNFLSTEVGSLIGQYKSYGVAQLTRTLYSGLQEGGSRFWYGAAAAVGFAIVLNEIKSRLFYDRSTFDRPATAVIADGVDRSSILGWFSDANRAVETLTGNRLGVRPMIGAARERPRDMAQIGGTLGGPAVGQAFRAGSVVSDFISGHPTAKTYNNWRTLLPGQNLPYLDPLFDHTISDGNFRRSLEPRRTQQPAG